MPERIETGREDVFKRIRAEILSCAIAPGQTLHESDLAKRFQMSKSPIRDALMRLEAEQLVIVMPRKGYRVAPVSISDAAELFEFRALMEETAARLTTSSAKDAELADLDRYRSLRSWGGGDDFVAYNRAFHLALAQLCPNRRISKTSQDLIEQFDRLVLISVSVADGRWADVLIAEHNAILDHVQAREASKAGQLIRRHIERARRRVMGSLSQSAIVA